MQITIYRGTHEIGGTLIEIKTPNSRILLDAGYPLFLNGLPIDDKLAKLPPKELLKLGVLPGIAGLYSWDTPAFDAVIISHAHLDHYGLLRFVHPDIPVYMSAGTERLIRITVLFKIYADNPPACRTFKMYQPFKIGDFTINPYLMDHSAFDAAAFEITAEGKTIIYTGDFRGHGRKAVCLGRFISGATQKADLLLTEGTMFGRKDEEILTEEQLEATAFDLISSSRGITLFQTSSQNIDRLVSFYKAAQKARKTFVVDVYTANVLYELRQLENNHLPYPSPEYKDIKVFYPYFMTQKIFNEIGEEYAKRFSAFHISRETLTQHQSEIVMCVRPSMYFDLAKCSLLGGTFIYSMWQGYRESEYQQKFEANLTKANFTTNFLHTSGHASIEDIQRVMTGLNPQKIIPIHTMYPDDFLAYSDKAEVVRDGVEIEL